MPLTIITGVGRPGQVGEAVALAFARRGDRLALIDRDAASAEQRAVALRGAGATVTAHSCDLTDPDAVAAAMEAIAGAHGAAAGALVHLAGGFGMGTGVADTDPELLARMLAINATTAFVTTRAALPMLRAGRGAALYFASAAVLPGGSVAGMGAYAMAKAAVVALVRAVAEEERPHGVRANALAPQAIRTADNVRAMGADARLVAREDVAAAALWLCGDAAREVTGQVIALG